MELVACMGRKRNAYQNPEGTCRETRQPENLDVESRIILRQIFKILVMKV
jgi:hypothetical protein